MHRKVRNLATEIFAFGRRIVRKKDSPIGVLFRNPADLSRSETSLRKVLIIGHCLAQGFATNVPGRRFEIEFFLFNNWAQLPDAPSCPVDQYDFQLVQFPLRDLLSDSGYFRLSYTDTQAYQDLFDQAVERIRHLLAGAMKWNVESGVLTFVMNFLPPQQNPLGKLLPRYDLRNFVYFVERLNETLCEELARYKNAYLLDIDQISANFGRKYFQDDVISALNHGAGLGDWDFNRDKDRLSSVRRATDIYGARTRDVQCAIWEEAISMYRVARQQDLVKLVIVDLDDTLWRGLVLEAGTFNSDTTEGWPLGLAEALLFLKRRGVLLAIASKNEQSRVEDIWDRIWLDRLKLEDFAIRKINWKSKAENVEQIIREANLLPSSVVFIDDNPVERAAVERALPGIRVLGAEPYILRRILLWSSETQTADISDVSSRRTELIQARVALESTRAQLSRQDFLDTLDLRMSFFEIRNTDDKNFARAFELINKTNQFNTTGRRWTIQEFISKFKNGLVLYAFDVEDRFTKYGQVGVIIVAGGEIEQFVMSCRVIGLDVEIAAIAEVCFRLRRKGIGDVQALYVETNENIVCRNVFQLCGFDFTDRMWVQPVAQAMTAPSHIQIQ